MERAARALRCLRRGSSKFSLWRGNNSLRRLHDAEDFRHRCGRHIADKRRNRCAGAIQSESDGGHRHGGESGTDPVRSLYPWVSRACVLAALAPPMALVSPALVICRNGLQRRYCNQLISFAYDRFGSGADITRYLANVRFASQRGHTRSHIDMSYTFVANRADSAS